MSFLPFCLPACVTSPAQLADDMMQGLEFLIDGYHPEVLELCPYASMWAWALSGFLHTGVGAALIFMVFNLLMQQTSVVNLGLKYCAFGFFAKVQCYRSYAPTFQHSHQY